MEAGRARRLAVRSEEATLEVRVFLFTLADGGVVYLATRTLEAHYRRSGRVFCQVQAAT